MKTLLRQPSTEPQHGLMAAPWGNSGQATWPGMCHVPSTRAGHVTYALPGLLLDDGWHVLAAAARDTGGVRQEWWRKADCKAGTIKRGKEERLILMKSTADVRSKITNFYTQQHCLQIYKSKLPEMKSAFGQAITIEGGFGMSLLECVCVRVRIYARMYLQNIHIYTDMWICVHI